MDHVLYKTIRIGLSLGLLSAGVMLAGGGRPEGVEETGLDRSPTSGSVSAVVKSIDTPETLPQLARAALEHYFATGDLIASPQPIPTEWQRSAGVFVTLSRDGRTRGCWGTLVPTSPDLAQATIRAALGAAQRDHRYPPLRASELPEVSIQVAVVREVIPIRSTSEIDPTRSGVFIRAGGQGGVLLPGEALTSEWQLATARRWAGIPDHIPVEIFRVDALLLHEY